MDKDIANRLKPLVEDKPLLTALNDYLEMKINGLRGQNDTAVGNDIVKNQGAIRELDSIKRYMRDEVLAQFKGA